MTGNAQKTHYARTINKFAEQKVLDAIQITGKSLPCRVEFVSGSIVTVSFLLNSSFTLPRVTCPMFGPEYIRYPTQVGDLGVVLSSDYYIGCVSGLGGGQTADLVQRANLSTLIFLPIANTGASTTQNWPANPSGDPNALTLYGKDRLAWLALHGTGAITGLGQESLDGSIATTGNLSAGTGATGTFQSSDGQTIVVIDGIVINIS